MKHSIRIPALLAAMSIFLVACAPVSPQEPIASTQEQKPSQPEKTQGEVASGTDSTYMNAALSFRDTSYCEKMSDAEARESCVQAVEQSGIMQVAVVEMDEQKCLELKSEADRVSCQAQVDVARTEAQKAEDQNTQIYDNETLLIEAVSTQNIALCDRIQDDQSKQTHCRDRVNSVRAAKEQNPALCEEITSEEEKALCASNFQQ